MKDSCQKLNNKKMNNEVYSLRRKVINIIYDIKKEVDLPRIEVRITDSHTHILGVGRMNCNIIWITEECINCNPKTLFHVVAHEIGHAVFGLSHDDNCKLMKPIVISAATKKQAINVLKKASSKKMGKLKRSKNLLVSIQA